MKRILQAGFLAACMAVLLPAVLWVVARKVELPALAEPVEAEPLPVREDEPAEGQTEEETLAFDKAQLVQLESDGALRQLPLRDYLAGVLMGELPPSFDSEAVAAQAVAARTFTLRQLQQGKHDGFLCDDAACCQAWLPEEQAREKLGDTLYEQWYVRVLDAIDRTDGQVLTYDGALIEALFFSCSGGRTEAAAEVWGGDMPYLVPVDSPGEEDAPRYCTRTEWTAADFRAAILTACPEAGLSGPPETWLGECEHTSGGGVKQVRIGEEEFSGASLRAILGLRSTLFTLQAKGDTISITTYGSGHRVGMSQYGAQAMAMDGADYKQILAHYYPETELITLPNA